MSTPADVAVPARSLVLATALVAATYGVLDALWLGVLSGDLYPSTIGPLLAEQQDVGAAVAMYAIYVAGLVWFVVRPGLARDRLRRSLLDAAAFGLVTFATFDLTSVAVFHDFPLTTALVDMGWGVLLCVAATAVSLGAIRSVESA